MTLRVWLQNLGTLASCFNKASAAGAEVEEVFGKIDRIWPSMCAGLEGMYASHQAVEASLGEIATYIGEAEERAARKVREATVAEVARARREEQERLRKEMTELRDRLEEERQSKELAESLLKDREGELKSKYSALPLFVFLSSFLRSGG